MPDAGSAQYRNKFLARNIIFRAELRERAFADEPPPNE